MRTNWIEGISRHVTPRALVIQIVKLNVSIRRGREGFTILVLVEYIWRGISHSDGMIKVDRNPTIASNTLWVDKNVPNTDVTVQNTRDVMKIAMS